LNNKKTYNTVQMVVGFERSNVASLEKPKLVCGVHVHTHQLAGADVDEECYPSDQLQSHSGSKGIEYSVNIHNTEVLTKLHRAPEKEDQRRWSLDEPVPIAAPGPALFR
jgi:hypothetical protein